MTTNVLPVGTIRFRRDGRRIYKQVPLMILGIRFGWRNSMVADLIEGTSNAITARGVPRRGIFEVTTYPVNLGVRFQRNRAYPSFFGLYFSPDYTEVGNQVWFCRYQFCDFMGCGYNEVPNEFYVRFIK